MARFPSCCLYVVRVGVDSLNTVEIHVAALGTLDTLLGSHVCPGMEKVVTLPHQLFPCDSLVCLFLCLTSLLQIGFTDFLQ